MKKLALLGLASALWLGIPGAQASDRFTISYSTGYGSYGHNHYARPLVRHDYGAPKVRYDHRHHHRSHKRHHHHSRAYPDYGYAPHYRGAPGYLAFRYDYRERNHHRRDVDRGDRRRDFDGDQRRGDGRRHR